MAIIVSQIRFDILRQLRDKGLLGYDIDSDRLADEAPLLGRNRIAHDGVDS